MARYGDAIEYDLQTLGLDLVDVFRGGLSWRKLEVVLDHLPVGSAYWAARAGDVEAAEELLASKPPGWEPPKGKKTGPPLHGLGVGSQQLLALGDLLAVISAKMDILAGNEHAKVDPLPKPVFGLEVALDRRDRAELGSLVREANAAIARSEAAEKEEGP